MSGASKANQRQNRVNKPKYERYKLNNVREKNKAIKLLKHLSRYPDDRQSQKALDNLPVFCVKHARKVLNLNS